MDGGYGHGRYRTSKVRTSVTVSGMCLERGIRLVCVLCSCVLGRIASLLYIMISLGRSKLQ